MKVLLCKMHFLSTFIDVTIKWCLKCENVRSFEFEPQLYSSCTPFLLFTQESTVFKANTAVRMFSANIWKNSDRERIRDSRISIKEAKQSKLSFFYFRLWPWRSIKRETYRPLETSVINFFMKTNSWVCLGLLPSHLLLRSKPDKFVL